MLQKVSHGLFCIVTLLTTNLTSAQILFRLSSKEDGFKIEDENIPFLTQSFFTCGSKDDCAKVAKKKGKSQFKEVTGKDTVGEESVVYEKVKGNDYFELSITYKA